MPKILVIDNDEEILLSIKEVFGTFKPDYEVLTAKSGKEGIKLAEIAKPDVILLDIVMPKVDGYEVCRQLKQGEEFKHILIIFLTGHKLEMQDRINGLDLGGDAYLTKPFDSGELIAQVDAMLRIKKAEDELRFEKESLERKVIERTKDLDIVINNLKDSREALHDSNQLKELLLDVLTHDLKNPVGSIIMLANVAYEDNPENEIFKYIHESSATLLNVIDHVTVLAQVAIGDKIVKEEIDLVKMIKLVVGEFSPRLESSGIAVQIDLPEVLVINANKIIIEVFRNFISNIIKYAKTGKKLIIDSEKKNGNIIVNFKDYGKSINKADYRKIFTRKYQIEKSRGRGLGLAIVKRIAEAHNAEVGVKANEPTGNIFYIEIPI